MAAGEMYHFIIAKQIVQRTGKGFFQNNWCFARIFYLNTAGDDVFFFKHTIVQPDYHIGNLFLHGKHQRFGGFLFCIIQSGHSRNRKSMGNHFPALEPEISRSASVGEGHPKHIISEIAYAAGRKLLGKVVQGVGPVASRFGRVAGKAHVRAENQVGQVFPVRSFSIIEMKQRPKGIRKHLIAAVFRVKGKKPSVF